MDEKNKELEELLLDIDILNELDKWTNKVNFFEVTGMSNQEIKHSNTLAWLFDANGNHGLKDQFVRRFLQKVISANVDALKNVDIFDVSLIDYDSFVVKREWKNIDLLIYSEELKMVITIENKVYSTESKGQLAKYHKIIKEEFVGYEKALYVYLTLEGEEPSDPENWCIADYKMIIDSLEESLSSSTTVDDKVKIIIKDYISMIRRNFGMDDELRETVQRIYLKHKPAFDLVFQVASTTHIHFSDYIKNWLNENKDKYHLNFDEKYSTITLIRFTTPFIDELFPFDEEKKDGWGFGYSFMYEIKIAKTGIAIIGVLSNFERPGSKTLMEYDTKAKAKQWRNVLKRKVLLSEEDVAEGLSEEIAEKLNNKLIDAITKYIGKFEKDVKEFKEKDFEI